VLWREYKGLTLGESQIRELLQRRVLLEPRTVEGAGSVILQLMDSGEIAEIPVPSGLPRQFGAKPARGGRASRRSPGSRATNRPDKGDPSAPPIDTPAEKKGRRPRTSKSADAAGPPAKEADGFHSVPLGACPLCGSDVVEQAKSFGCSKWREGCRFAIWKTIAGKAIGARTAEALIRGFKSKAGNRFEARLKLEGGEVRFDFDPDDRRRPPRGADTV
jgi:DNA topoisomerase-3